MGFLLGFNAHYINITDEQYLDVCLTTLKILNEKQKNYIMLTKLSQTHMDQIPAYIYRQKMEKLVIMLFIQH